VADDNPFRQHSRHLYIVAGYPTSGKSSSLWQCARFGRPLFGEAGGSVIPPFENLQGIREDFDTAAKLKAGFWITLADLPKLSRQHTLPPQLILHLDLLVAYLRYRAGPAAGFDAAFARLFAEPALQGYGRYSVTTLHTPLEEIQRRWRYRYRNGIPSDCGKLFAEKDKLIMDERVAAGVFTGIYEAWDRCLASLARNGLLAAHAQARSRLRANLPVAASPVPRPSA
jgi:hypothetical protein